MMTQQVIMDGGTGSGDVERSDGARLGLVTAGIVAASFLVYFSVDRYYGPLRGPYGGRRWPFWPQGVQALVELAAGVLLVVGCVATIRRRRASPLLPVAAALLIVARWALPMIANRRWNDPTSMFRRSWSSGRWDRVVTYAALGWITAIAGLVLGTVAVVVSSPSWVARSQRQSAATAAPGVVAPAGWLPDPLQRAEVRYWDGAQWTPHVVRFGQQGVEPDPTPWAAAPTVPRPVAAPAQPEGAGMWWYVKRVFGQYATFRGRASRAEYWWFALADLLVLLPSAAIAAAFDVPLIYGVAGLWAVAVWLPWWAVTVRRLHDSDRSGWFLLLAFIPLIGSIVLLVYMLVAGTRGPNRYGPPPP